MPNNAELGMTIQKLICDKFEITPHPNACSQFEASYNPDYKNAANRVIKRIFDELSLEPVECLTFVPSTDPKETLMPHNFTLSNGKTLSIRTNLKGDKVAPRVVGQAGIKTFNEHFSEIAGFEITDKSEIKRVIFEKIHLMLPVFIDYFFLSDYTVWIQTQPDDEFSYTIFDKNSIVDINLERDNFSFTRDLSSWVESTTLKYKGKSLAEIQIHTNRVFKFRFILNTLSELLIEQKITTETLGITAEKGICDLFKLPTPSEYRGRYSVPLLKDIEPVLKNAFKHLPDAVKSTGAEQGSRGSNSKCSYDFILAGDKTLSLKTNTGKMICPPEVGQPGAATCYLYFHEYIDEDEVTPESFKKMVISHIAEIMPIYVSHLFDSDYLLWVFKTGSSFDYKIYRSDFTKNFKWEKEYFEFSKPTLESWNESNTVRYKGLGIGEFQVHKNRSCYKFRFNMENFEKLITNEIYDKEAD